LRSNDSDVHRPLTPATLIVLDVELDFLPFLERIELAPWKRGVVEEDLTAVLGSDEGKSTVANDSNDRPLSHEYSPYEQSNQHTAC
jgi:hypothetical protein